MPRRVAALICLVIGSPLALLAGEAAVPAAGADAIATPAEFLKLMEDSKTHYVIKPLTDLKDVPPSEFAIKLWPANSPGLAHPFVKTSSGGNAVLTEYPVSEEAVKALKAADAYYEKKKYDEAETAYLDVTKRFPDWYLAHIFLGDIAFERGENLKAIAAYREGIRLNPYDYAGFLFEGHALAKLGRTDEALDAWVHALTLRAYQDSTMKLAATYSDALGIAPHPERFEPKAFVRPEADTIAIYVGDSPAWIAWALCKAVWLGEPAYRARKGGKDADAWSSREDRECMANLLAKYLDLRDRGETPADPNLDRLSGLVTDHLFTEYVVYEFGSRISPDVLLLASGQGLELERFVRTYVVPKVRVTAAVPEP